MFVVTFYSYKGGVGRTSAMVNTASRLAQARKKVLIVDFDLEAPGIDAFPSFSNDQPRNGVVEYITHFTQTGKVAPIEDFVYRVKLDSVENEVLFMPAGRKDRQYQSDLSRLDWKMLYRQKKGFLFIENLKASLKQEFNPDYVLIDSRTGLTDVSGICTIQLPNLVVLLFSLNNQNLRGTSQIYQSVRFNKVGRQIFTVLVASPIPEIPDSVGIRKERLEYARKIISSPADLVLPYDSFVAFQETIVTRQETSSSLSKSYDALTQRVIASNPTDVITLLRQAKQLAESGNDELAELRYQETVELRPQSPEAWLEFAMFSRMRGRLKDSVSYLDKALKLDPANAQILTQIATTYLAVNRYPEAKDALRRLLAVSSDVETIQSVLALFSRAGLLEDAELGYRYLIRVGGGQTSYIALGEIYVRLKKFREAFEVYITALKLFPTNLVITYNLGHVLSQFNDKRALEYFRKAIELFEQMDKTTSTPIWEANARSAIGLAYAAIGKKDKAIQNMTAATAIAKKLEKAQIFSPISYTHVSRDQFIHEIEHLTASMRRDLSVQLM